jgi:mannose-6-phosphate isomerase-like protein (cupin superfamily)
MAKPIIASGVGGSKIAASGNSFEVHEWSGSGPDYLHVHYADDEAWHILKGTLTFKFSDGELEVSEGSSYAQPRRSCLRRQLRPCGARRTSLPPSS